MRGGDDLFRTPHEKLWAAAHIFPRRIRSDGARRRAMAVHTSVSTAARFPDGQANRGPWARRAPRTTEQYALPVRILMTSRKRKHAPSATRNQYAPSVAGAEQNRNAVPVPAEGPAAAEAYATRHRNPAEQAASKRPATGTHRVSRDADTRPSAPRAQTETRTPANMHRAYRPEKRAPQKRAATPGTKCRNPASKSARHREVRLSVPQRRFPARSTRPDGPTR